MRRTSPPPNGRWEKNHIAGRGSDTLPGGKWLFQPLRTGRGPLGVVGIIRDEPGPLLTPDQQRLLDALADQAALAIERVNLARDLHRARLQVETDRLRSALLTSISHDLRTPLASILGSATSLRSQDAILDTPTKEALLGTIIEESDRLNRFIGNLLDMTRLESGALKPRTGLNELSEVIGVGLAAGARKSWRGTGSRSICRPTCRCWRWIWCCSSRCCSICWTTPPNTPRSAAKSPSTPAATAIPSRCASGRRRRHPAERCRSHLRKILPRRRGRPQACRNRIGSRDLPRIRGSHGWNHHGHEPPRLDRPARCHVRHHPAGPRQRAAARRGNHA